MSFSDYYFGEFIKKSEPILGRVGFIQITEQIYNKLSKLFSKDYKYIVEAIDYKDDYGYGFKYTLKNKDNIILVNRWKDEVNNNDSKIYIKESTYNEIKGYFKIDGKIEF